LNLKGNSVEGEAQPVEAGSGIRYGVGTLVYTEAGLFSLFAWLLWADVYSVLMEAVPGLVPLKLKAIDTPNWLMTLILLTPVLLVLLPVHWVVLRRGVHWHV
jgi:hypothetical protein